MASTKTNRRGAIPIPRLEIINLESPRHYFSRVLPCLLRKHRLNLDTITLFVGDRGSGKSIGSVATAILDYGLEGYPIWSNMEIKTTFTIGEEFGSEHGVNPGSFTIESMPVDKDRFLDGDPEYQGGCIVIEEINIWLADARRAMSNQNLAASDLVQMIRKLKTALIANCIHEMFVDNRIRDAIDNYVVCEDKALLPEGHITNAKQGEAFQLKVWPQTRKLNGWRHWEGGIEIINLPGKMWWGAYDTNQRQERIKYQANKASMDVETMIGEAPEVKEFRGKWAGIENRLMNLSAELGRNGHKTVEGPDGQELIVINSKEFYPLMGIPDDVLSDPSLDRALTALGVVKMARLSSGGRKIGIPVELGLVTS